MNTPHKILITICLLLIGSSSFGASLPTLHAMGEHHHVVLQVPESVHPVTIKVIDAQQQVFLNLTVNAVEGVYEKLNFSWMPTGNYLVEVSIDGQVFYKSVHVLQDRVSALDATPKFRTTPHTQL